jgi:hypothetical protein
MSSFIHSFIHSKKKEMKKKETPQNLVGVATVSPGTSHRPAKAFVGLARSPFNLNWQRRHGQER